MKTYITQNGVKIHRILSGRNNVFSITYNNRFILIDTGRTASRRKLLKIIDSLCLNNKMKHYLVLTHSHFDHCENAQSVKNTFKSKVIIHETEARHLSSGDSPLPEGTNVFTQLILRLFGSKYQKLVVYKGTDADILIQEDNLYSIDDCIKIIHTPGHTRGSISIIVDNEVALCGDALFGVFPWSVFPPFGDNVSEMINSWEKLLSTGSSTFLPAHGRPVSREKLERQYKKMKFNCITYF
jgi:hydroxyacylglutathione hydrolase